MNMDTPDNPDSPANRVIDNGEWFLREVEKGLAAAEGGKLVDHCDVRKLIDERYPG
jgi:predicted transcriptional regulator